MQCEQYSFLFVRTRVILFGEAAVRVKRLVDGAVVVKHQVWVVPLPAELQGRLVVAHVFADVIMGIDRRRSALEISARTFLKASGHGETVEAAALCAESAFAGDIGRGVAAPKRGRDRDVDYVVS